MAIRQVRPDCIQTKARVSDALAAGWSRCVAKAGRGTFADRLEVDVKTVNRALTGETTPELHTAFNALCADKTALDEVAKLYGVKIVPDTADAANDLNTAAGVMDAMSELVRAHADGVRHHHELLAVVKLLRPHMPALSALVDEADSLRRVG